MSTPSSVKMKPKNDMHGECKQMDVEEESKQSPDWYHQDIPEFDFNGRVAVMSSTSGTEKPPSQPATAAANSIHWDVEEDHLLSYFLGAEGGTNDGSNIPTADIAVEQLNDINNNQQGPSAVEPPSIRPASQPNSHSNIASIQGAPSLAASVGVAPNASLGNFVHARARDSSEGLSRSASLSSSGAGLPPTPAVHFYDGHHPHHQYHNPLPPPPTSAVASAAALASHQQQQHQVLGTTMPVHSSEYNTFVNASQHHRHQSSNSLQNQKSASLGSMHKVPSRTSTTSSGSSSSSLASMAAALALGGPNQVMYMQQKLQSRDQVAVAQYQLNNTSPITPVNMLGSPSGQEMMMLPPPPRFPNGVLQHQNYMGHPQQMQGLMHQQVIPQPQVIPSMSAVPNMAAPSPSQQQQQQQQQHPNFLPQMDPAPAAIQHPQQMTSMGFPNPSAVTSSVLAQPQMQHMQQQMPQQVPPQQQQQPTQQPQQEAAAPQQQQPHQPQQIQIGLNGQTIPITAVPGANGSVYYQIDPNAVPAAGLRYFTKAINEVSREESKEAVDPKVLAEKRAQRLARNRESARNSRRRKKEHLSNLSAKVSRLQRQLDGEVRNKVRSMEGGLVRQRSSMIDKWLSGQEKKKAAAGDTSAEDENESHAATRESRNQLALIVRKTGVNCQIRRAVIAHQYNFLRQALLSTHNRYSIWMMMQPPSFFTEATRRRNLDASAAAAAGESGKGKTTGSRPNSKQIGEEIYNDEKMAGEKGSVTCRAHDEERTWPLYCHEITMTMEQEDRIVNQAHEAARSMPNLEPNLQRMRTAIDATSQMQNAMLCHTQLASQRNETVLLDILTPTQTALFLDWFKANKERCRKLMELQLRAAYDAGVAAAATAEGSAENGRPGESMLGGVCRQLDDIKLEKE